MSLHDIKVWHERVLKVQAARDHAIARDTEAAKSFVETQRLVASACVTKANYIRPSKAHWLSDPVQAMEMHKEVQSLFTTAAFANHTARRYKLRAEGRQLEMFE